MSLGIRAWTMDGVAVSALLFVAAPVLSQDATRVAAFRADCAARFESADKAGSMSVPGKNGWLFLAKELRHISVGKFWGENAVRVTRADKPEWADPLPAILDFKAQLDKASATLETLQKNMQSMGPRGPRGPGGPGGVQGGPAGPGGQAPQGGANVPPQGGPGGLPNPNIAPNAAPKVNQ